MKGEEIEGYEMHVPLSISLFKHFDIAGFISTSIPMIQLSSSFYFKKNWARKY
jgi:hypothetical protein